MSQRQQQAEGNFWGNFFKLGAVAAAGAAVAAAVYYAAPETESEHRPRPPEHRPTNSRQRQRSPPKWAGGVFRKNDKFVPKSERVAELEEAFKAGTVDCGICLANLAATSRIWSCSECYSSFHLECVAVWASECGRKGTHFWECPICRNQHQIPTTDFLYKCFCGQKRNPPHIPGKTPHTCDDVCGKSHHCVLKCHPGPCVY